MHTVVQNIHEALRSGKKPELSTLLDLAKNQLPTVGYLTAQSRQRAHKQAVETIKSMYNRFINEDLPSENEKKFRVEIPDTDLILTGRIDAVYHNNKTIEIRDFKTGLSISSPDKAKKRAQANQQLALYALAWKLLYNEIPSLLTLDFIETNQQGSVKKQEKTLDTLLTKLRKMVESLGAGKYEPGHDHTYCTHPL